LHLMMEDHLHTFPAVASGEVRAKEYTEATKPPAASAGRGAVVISTDAVTPSQMSDGSAWLLLGAGAASGDNIQVNGVAVTDANFNDTVPAAAGGFTNVKWQRSGSGPDSISAFVPTSVPTARLISAGGGLFGGGDLSSDRT